MESKKAQNLSITTIILIILGIVVLVVLIIGFTQGWNSVKEWFTGGKTIAPYVTQCSLACTTENTFGWCEDPIEGVIEETCVHLAQKGKVSECEEIRCRCTQYEGYQTCGQGESCEDENKIQAGVDEVCCKMNTCKTL